MCLEVTHVYSCGHVSSAIASCATSKTYRCNIHNTKTIKHEIGCDICNPSVHEDVGRRVLHMDRRSRRQIEKKNERGFVSLSETDTAERVGEGTPEDSSSIQRPSLYITTDDEIALDKGSSFPTSTSPADSQLEESMAKIREKAMDFIMHDYAGAPSAHEDIRSAVTTRNHDTADSDVSIIGTNGQPAPNDGGLVFITGSKPTDFKSKTVMTQVRKKAMDRFLWGDKKSRFKDKDVRNRIRSALISTSLAHAGTSSMSDTTRQNYRDSGYFTENDPSSANLKHKESSSLATIDETSATRTWAPLDNSTYTLSTQNEIQQGSYNPTTIDLLDKNSPPHTNEPGGIQNDTPWTFDEELLLKQMRDAGKSWNEIAMANVSMEDLAEERRIQNLIAQRNYRKKLRQRLEVLKRPDGTTASESIEHTESIDAMPNDDLPRASQSSIDSDISASQYRDDLVTIRCVCGTSNDRRFIVPCTACATWQHIACYYELAQDVVENHECVQCVPRELNGHTHNPMKRPADANWDQDTNPSTTRSTKHPKTLGAESSINLAKGTNRRSAAMTGPSHLTNPSSTPTSPTQSMASIMSSGPGYFPNLSRKKVLHAALAESALRENTEVLISPSNKDWAEGSNPSIEEPGSKAVNVESANKYTKELAAQVSERDRLLKAEAEEVEWLQKGSKNDPERLFNTPTDNFTTKRKVNKPREEMSNNVQLESAMVESEDNRVNYNNIQLPQHQLGAGQVEDMKNLERDDKDIGDSLHQYERAVNSPQPDAGTEESTAIKGESSQLKTHEPTSTSAVPTMRKRLKVGCLTCCKRHIRCGEERPTCLNCTKSKRQCEGYVRRIVFRQPYIDCKALGIEPVEIGSAHRYVTEHVLKVAMQNRVHGKKIIKLLCEALNGDVPVTEDVMVAFVRSNCGKDIMELMQSLLVRRGKSIHVTENVLIAAAENKYGSEMMQFIVAWLPPRGPITDKVLKAAAANTNMGEEIMQFLLSCTEPELMITEEVLVAASKGTTLSLVFIDQVMNRKNENLLIEDAVLAVAVERGEFLEAKRRILELRDAGDGISNKIKRPTAPLVEEETSFIGVTRGSMAECSIVAGSNSSTDVDENIEHSRIHSTETSSLPFNDESEASILSDQRHVVEEDLDRLQALLPESWRWDVEFQTDCWTCTPLEAGTPENYPLKIADLPVVLPVEYRWPPIGGVNPPPDPRPSASINCKTQLELTIIRDIFLTFEGSIGFYLLINGLLQIIVPKEFDITWASSHLPHKYGGLKVCYIPQTLEATMLPSITETRSKPALNKQSSSLSSIFRQSRTTPASSNLTLKLNDFIEAKPRANHRKEKYSGRIGLKVAREGDPYLLMSTHVITEAILAKSHRDTLFGRGHERFERLDEDWNIHAEIWAGNESIGTIERTFDTKAEIYPHGFCHDVTLIKPTSPSFVKDVSSTVPDLGWLNHESWSSLRQQASAVKVLGSTESHRSAKSLKCSRPSEILVVGEGIFLNQTAAVGNSKSLKDHDMSTWKNLVSRALLYRVYPDFDPPNGHSGVALYADGLRQDGTEGPGIVGFQSFVQRSGHVQNFNMEGPALEKRLQLGRVAFYGAFEVPEELKREYTIV